MGIALMYLIIEMYRVLHLKSKQNSDYMGIYSLTLLAIINSMVSGNMLSTKELFLCIAYYAFLKNTIILKLK